MAVQIPVGDSDFNSFGIHLEVELLNHLAVVFLISWGIFWLFFIEAAPFYTPIDSDGVLESNLRPPCQHLFFSDCGHPNGREAVTPLQSCAPEGWRLFHLLELVPTLPPSYKSTSKEPLILTGVLYI